MKAIKFISSVVLLLSMVCLCCTDDSSFSPTGEIEERKFENITGNSFLKVTNECSDCGDVYFDGKLIGEVDNGLTRTWRVPEGWHIVRVYGEYKEDCGGQLEFKAGEITTVCMKSDREIEINDEFSKPTR